MTTDCRNAVDGFSGINFHVIRLLSTFNSNIDEKAQPDNQFVCSSESFVLHFVGNRKLEESGFVKCRNPPFLLYEISYEKDAWQFLPKIADLVRMRRFDWRFLGFFLRDLKATVRGFLCSCRRA
ncbi:hypothetical protein [Achromobacter aegrifaciens]